MQERQNLTTELEYLREQSAMLSTKLTELEASYRAELARAQVAGELVKDLTAKLDATSAERDEMQIQLNKLQHEKVPRSTDHNVRPSQSLCPPVDAHIHTPCHFASQNAFSRSHASSLFQPSNLSH